jgi:hypothetical protein
MSTEEYKWNSLVSLRKFTLLPKLTPPPTNYQIFQSQHLRLPIVRVAGEAMAGFTTHNISREKNAPIKTMTQYLFVQLRKKL